MLSSCDQDEKMQIKGCDFHCHVDLYRDPETLITSCEGNQIVTFAVTTTPKAWPQNRSWTADSLYVHPAVGLHPELVGERYAEISLLEEYIKESRLVGEVGLDGSPQHRRSWAMQMEVLVRALTGAQRLGGRVVSIHSRRAAKEVIRCLEEQTTSDRVLPILHWFSGSIAEARKGADLGCYFSINHRSLDHPTGMALVRSLPEDRLLTETDAPFSAIGDRQAEPSDVIATVDRVAAVRGVGVPEMTRLIMINAQRVLAFAGLNVEANIPT
jgi:TatD DNase family protein